MFSTTPTSAKKFNFPFTVFPGTILAILYFLALLPWLGKNRLIGLDESMYADIAFGVGRENHWWPLIFHAEPFWDKPPVQFWLQGLTIKLFGANEFAVRLWPAFGGALCVYFVTRLGTVLGKSVRAGMFCGILMILQEHFILYSRVATLDVFLLGCLLGAWWHLTMAFNPPSHEDADKELLYAGLWMAAAVSIKSWHGFVLVPAFILALLYCRPWPFSPKQVFFRLFFPALLVMAVWMTCNSLTFGKLFLQWEWSVDVSARAHGASFGSLSSIQYHLDFYWILIQKGMAFLWPVLPLCFFLWVRENWTQARQGHFDSINIIGTTFFFYYLFFILFCITTLINYLLPLVPLAVLSLVFLFRFRDDRRVVMASVLTIFLGVINGFTGDAYLEWTVMGSLVSCLFLVLPAQWGLREGWLATSLLIWILCCGFKTQDYWRNPPDPNRVWVLAVLAHPAEYPGETLYFVGDEPDARALEFYSAYHVYLLGAPPAIQPEDGALLFEYEKRAIYLPIPRKALPESILKGEVSLQ